MLNELEIDEYTLKQKKEMFLHSCIALFCVPLYMLGPNLLAYILTPYLAWMIFQGKSEFYIPLMIHTFYGSQQRTIMLTCCFIYCIFHVAQLARYGVRWLFLLYLLLSPFFVWFTYARFQYQGWGGMFEGWGCYMTFAAFFWGLLTGGGVRKSIFTYLFVLSIFWTVASNLGIVISTRFTHWSEPYGLIFAFWLILRRKCNIFNPFFVASMLMVILAALSFLRFTARSITFTQLGITAFGCAFLFFCRRGMALTRCLLHPLILFPLIVYLTFSAMDKYLTGDVQIDYSVAYEDIEVKDFKGLRERFERKAVGDRGILWAATWNVIRRQFSDNPFHVTPWAQIGEVERTLSSGKQVVQQIELSAHNTFLELLRNYGLYGGGGMYLIFVLVALVLWRRHPLERFMDTQFAPVFAACLGHIYAGGMGGQYLVLPQFSFILFGLLGYCFRASFYDHRIFIDRRLAFRAPQPEGWMVG